jgi:tRNA pseudouridine38-40 synthase
VRSIKLTLSYDGTDFHGWQRQAGLRTVQESLEDALQQLTGARPVATASGRTDAGVHALGQVVHFLTASRHSTATFVRALNALLPRDLRVLAAAEVSQAFHATLDARSKRYRYVIDNGPVASPFQL